MSGGFQYNMTTQSEFEQMKQRNYELSQQNQALKQSLEELIKINNELTDSMEQFNASAAIDGGGNKQNSAVKDEQMSAELEYYKNLVYSNQDKNQIIGALQGLIDSFNQTQKLYQKQISNICEQLDHYKSEWQQKLASYQQLYINKLKSVQYMISQIRKKQQIVSIIQKKMQQQQKLYQHQKQRGGSRIQAGNRIKKKYSQFDRTVADLDRQQTISQKKAQQTTAKNNGLMKSQQLNFYQKQLDALKEREKQLAKQITDRNTVIAQYVDLMGKLRKKLIEKY